MEDIPGELITDCAQLVKANSITGYSPTIIIIVQIEGLEPGWCYSTLAPSPSII